MVQNKKNRARESTQEKQEEDSMTRHGIWWLTTEQMQQIEGGGEKIEGRCFVQSRHAWVYGGGGVHRHAWV